VSCFFDAFCAGLAGGAVNGKERYIRRVKTKRECHRSIIREEKRKEEVRKVFEICASLQCVV
jgi:hypothetical protein